MKFEYYLIFLLIIKFILYLFFRGTYIYLKVTFADRFFPYRQF